MLDPAKSFMGRGWAFPIRFDNHGGVKMLAGEEDIANSLDVIFTTRVGERIMQPDFGSELDAFVFTPLNKSILTYMRAIVSDAVLFYEPRVLLEDVQIAPLATADGALEIRLTYRVSATNSRYNYVYPFFHREGTNLAPSLHK